jgi:hypothetical protein
MKFKKKNKIEGMKSDPKNKIWLFHFFHVWKLWIENNPMELIDELKGDLCTLYDVLRYIHLGLLCVQQKPEDRPNNKHIICGSKVEQWEFIA